MKRVLRKMWRGFNRFSVIVLAPSLIGLAGVWIPRHEYPQLPESDSHRH